MIKRKKIEYLYKRIRREEALEKGEPFELNQEIESISKDWINKYYTPKDKTIRFYEDNYSDKLTHIIKLSSDSKILNYDKRSEISFFKAESEFKIKKPHYFIELKLIVEANNSNSIKLIDTEEDKVQINLKKGIFHQIKRSSQRARQLIVREQILNLLIEIWDAIKLPPSNIKIAIKKVHFIDTSLGVVHNAVINIIGDIFKLDPVFINQSITKKFKSFQYFYDTMNYEYIEFYKSSKRTTYNGLRLVASNDYKDQFAVLDKRVNKDEEVDIILKQIFLNSKKVQSSSLCIPIYHNCIVFKNSKNRIEGVFNICFDSKKIENNFRVEMKTNDQLFSELIKIISVI